MSRYALPLLVLLSGCAAPAIVGPVRGGDLGGAAWVLRQFDAKHVKRTDPEAATLRLVADHSIDGMSACNDVGGKELTWSANASGKSGEFDRDRTRTTITTAVGCADASAVRLGERFWAYGQGAGVVSNRNDAHRPAAPQTNNEIALLTLYIRTGSGSPSVHERHQISIYLGESDTAILRRQRACLDLVT